MRKVVESTLFTNILVIFSGLILTVSSAFATYSLLVSTNFSINTSQGWIRYDTSGFLRSLKTSIPKAYIVQSGSMEPSIKTGSIVFVRPQQTYFPGDIVTFRPNGFKTQTITHRINFKTYPDGTGGEAKYVTSGDANGDFDSWEVKNANIIGKVIISVPYLGYLADYAKRPWGFILLVIVPATLVIYEEFKFLAREFSKLTSRLIKKVCRGGERPNTHFLTRFFPRFGKAWIIIPLVIVSFIILTSFSNSFYSDKEGSGGNIFQAASSFGNVLSAPETLGQSRLIEPTETLTPTPRQQSLENLSPSEIVETSTTCSSKTSDDLEIISSPEVIETQTSSSKASSVILP